MLPPCPQCNSPYAYEDGAMLVCPECGHEWARDAGAAEAHVFRDCNGAELQDGDSVTVIKDLKFRGGVVKVGTKVKSIRLIQPEHQVGGHDIDCKIPGIGQIGLKTEFVKKIS